MTQKQRYNYEQVAIELVRAVRGKRSCAELSRRGGYKGNAVHRWESGQCWPTVARFLLLHRQVRPNAQSWIEGFYRTSPNWSLALDPCSPDAVPAFLRSLKGNAQILRIAEAAGRNRFSVSRWFEGTAEPKLPDFLRLVDVASGRLLDLIAALVDPKLLPSLRKEWTQLQLARQSAYELPWSHGVMRALELSDLPTGTSAQKAWLARQLSIPAAEVALALEMLEATSQVTKGRNGYRLQSAGKKVDTSEDPERARGLKAAWTKTALERLEAGQPGRFGYSVFAVSHSDLKRIHELHLRFVREAQAIIAESSPNECVGLYCSQLLDLSGREM